MKIALIVIVGIIGIFGIIYFSADGESIKYYDEFTEQDIKDFEKELFELTNQKRIENNVSVLDWDEELASIARGHSQDMAENDFFSHVNLNGIRSNDRAINAGYECEDEEINNIIYEGISENISQMGLIYQDYELDDAQRIIDGLMNSTEHRDNMLKQTDSKIGIAIAINENHLYTTQNFC